MDYKHVEWDTILPSNPYSASKAAQEAICYSYWRTYDVPVVITNTMNIIGEMQDAEKFVPKVIKNLLEGRSVPVHSDKQGNSGSRFYLHARNLADAWMTISNNHIPAKYSAGFERPDRYHIVGEREVANDEMVGMIAEILGVTPQIRKVDFHTSRPGHDLRYALDGQKIAEEIRWSHPIPFEESLRKTVLWTKGHPEWLA
jgi:dTDP-glucose 4,6-dehydratase